MAVNLVHASERQDVLFGRRTFLHPGLALARRYREMVTIP